MEYCSAEKVGTHVSHIWWCCPSAFNPEVGPSVLSDAGEPASPNAPAVPIIAIVAIGLNPSWIQSGTKIVVKMGMVEKEDPIPIVTSNPIISMRNAASGLLFPIK